MKKVSLLLAVLLIMTCCLLAACGDDGEATSSADSQTANTSTPASSAGDTTSEQSSASAESSAPVESSAVDESSAVEESSTVDESSVDETTPDESSVDESSVEESSVEESSTPETSTEQPSGTEPSGENLALGKSYTGGDPSTHDGVSHYNAKLTDGKALGEISYDGEWFAFYNNADATAPGNINAPDRVGTVVIDLEQVCSVSKVQVNAFLGNASGIVAPASVKVEVSSDGSSYTQFGSTKNFDKPAENDTTVDWVVFTGSAEGRYVKVTVTMDPYAPFAFLNEIEVY